MLVSVPQKRALLIAVSVTLATTTEAFRSYRERERPTPAPTFPTLATASRQQMLEYAHALSFDTSYDAIDSRRLMTRNDDGSIHRGALVTLQPEIGTTALRHAEMFRGRIILRVVSDADDVASGYAKGENFIWVDSVGGQARAVVIPANPMMPLRELGFHILHDQGAMGERAPQARLRWNETLGRDDGWVRCDDGCCYLSGGRGLK